MKNIKVAITILASVLAFNAHAQQVISTSLVVKGSACVGFDCPSTPSFGFDTLRLQENNLRMHFDDTSVAASFPDNDWRLIANDSANGGGEYFAIEDASSGNRPFRVEAGARNNALYVDSQGDVGVGTSTPAVDMHLVIGDTPTLRLEQNGSSGFTPQVWDVAGNETNFFVRDVTNGSLLPFRIRPAAPTNSIFVDVSGDVGLGTSSPSEALHILDNDGDTRLKIEETSTTQAARDLIILENKGNPEIRMTNTGNSNSWVMSAGARYVIKNNAGTSVSRIDSAGNLEITGSLTTTGGTCGGGGCDLVFHPDTRIETIDEHAAQMWSNSYLPAVGPTPENKPFNISQKTGGMLNELEKAHIYIEQLHQRQVKSELAIQQLQKENLAMAASQKAVSLKFEEQLDQLKAMLIDLQLSTQPQDLLTSTN